MQTDFEHEDINAVLPGNVKQMGAPDDELRIYMEDYVHTYLYQYSRSSVNGEKLAVLMGQSIVINIHKRRYTGEVYGKNKGR